MASGTCGKNLTWTLDNGTLTIRGTGNMFDCASYGRNHWLSEPIKRVVINDGVTTIGKWFFSGYRDLTSVTIPDSVTTIGKGAFFGCYSLTNVTIPDSVTTIGKGAFGECESLTRVTIPDSVTTIGKGAFGKCRSLTSVTIPNSVKTIDDYAFSECANLTSVIIPDGVTTIGKQAFFGCYSLTSVTIPESVTSIGGWVLRFCTSLKEIHYPAGRGFEDNLREGNDAKLIPYTPNQKPAPAVKPTLKPAQIRSTPKAAAQPAQPVAKPQPVAQAVAEPLRWTFAVKTLTIGGVREIKDYSREEPPWRDKVRDVQKIVFEEGVEKIAANAFIDCTRLEQVIIPATVKTIGELAFTTCYCGERMVNNCRNVLWSLNDGVLTIRKNPDAKSEKNFETGYAKWQVVEKNIVSVKIERGVVPGKQFFDWLAQRGNALQVSFE